MFLEKLGLQRFCGAMVTALGVEEVDDLKLCHKVMLASIRMQPNPMKKLCCGF